MLKKISYNSNIKIVTKHNKKNIYKIKTKNNNNIYDYLNQINFTNFLKPLFMTEKYEVYPYLEQQNNYKDINKILINLMIKLHTLTTEYKKTKIEEIEQENLKINNKINILLNNYYKIQDYLEEQENLNAKEYLLLLNISNFYKALKYSKKQLDLWLNIAKEETTERTVLINNNISSKNLITAKENYIFNWDKALRKNPIYDFINFYQKEFLNADMYELYNLYQLKYKYSEKEQFLFNSLIAIPPEINLDNLANVNKEYIEYAINYLNKTDEFLSKYYKEKQETNN